MTDIIKHGKRTARRPCKYCGKSGLYWGHNLNGPSGRKYCGEHSSANWTLVDFDGILHDCQGNGGRGHDDDETGSETHAEPAAPAEYIHPQVPPAAPAAAAVPAAPAAGTDPMLAAFQSFMALVAPKVDATQVEAIVEERLRGLVLPLRVEVSRNGNVKPVEGLAHKSLPIVITILSTGKHVMMVGPAGTGKSHLASQAAEALSLESYSISLSPQTPTSAILGYKTATGDYNRSLVP